ncbi:hypothetical protein GCM10010832_04900 [Psychroflexus planctonicus]|uniref:Uncharacterized protein n=1 Tax=Psychroflexus planctonicus TaxID=1526575 RepID=A0ABQ1SG52_9FLAO|nr:hypothetical protein GCM10010832_04900 [Psychroflexus planctonicus]
MKNNLKKLLFLAFLISTSFTFGQNTIYKVFKDEMTKEEVRQAYAANRTELKNILFAESVAWDIDLERFKYDNNKLKVVSLVPSGMGNGFNYIKTVTHLKSSKDFLLSLGYTITHENKWWYRPQSFVDQSFAYGLVLKGPNNLNYVNLYTYKNKGSYIPVIYIFPVEYLETHFQNNTNAQTQESGF